MPRLPRAAALAILLSAACSRPAAGPGLAPRAAAGAVQPIEVLLIGTFHFAQIDTLTYDVLKAPRRAEAERVVDALVRWAPAKVFVESQPEFNQLAYDSLMQAHPAGADLPRRNEIYRLGMRTALRLGQRRVYLVDHPGRYGSLRAEMERVADATGKRAVMEGRDPFVQHALYERESGDEKRPSMTLPAYLQYLNSAEYRRTDHGVYVSRYPRVGWVRTDLSDSTGMARAGSELVADWYRRNVMIYSKTLNWMDWSERRIVIIIGAGHVPILRHLFESHGSFRVVEVDDVLPRQ
ncbi:MAG: hypothetical protein IT353_11425 [Gemmatimonadaceae bacterium]|nr:hypothetical protein [Gemmatimonadaceae bacterium]